MSGMLAARTKKRCSPDRLILPQYSLGASDETKVRTQFNGTLSRKSHRHEEGLYISGVDGSHNAGSLGQILGFQLDMGSGLSSGIRPRVNLLCSRRKGYFSRAEDAQSSAESFNGMVIFDAIAPK
ncbi:MAG: hypothetical protein U0931_26910 [Vulcanimicrobiota bacterium]